MLRWGCCLFVVTDRSLTTYPLTFWLECISLISLLMLNEAYDGSHIVNLVGLPFAPLTDLGYQLGELSCLAFHKFHCLLSV